MEKLAALVPLPRVHLVRYGGCLAPHSLLRGAITPTPRQQGVEEPEASRAAPHWSWARLLKRVFALDMATCPSCHRGALWIIAVITQGGDPNILRHLKLAADPPPLAPARARQASHVRLGRPKGYPNKLIRWLALKKTAEALLGEALSPAIAHGLRSDVRVAEGYLTTAARVQSRFEIAPPSSLPSRLSRRSPQGTAGGAAHPILRRLSSPSASRAAPRPWARGKSRGRSVAAGGGAGGLEDVLPRCRAKGRRKSPFKYVVAPRAPPDPHPPIRPAYPDRAGRTPPGCGSLRRVRPGGSAKRPCNFLSVRRVTALLVSQCGVIRHSISTIQLIVSPCTRRVSRHVSPARAMRAVMTSMDICQSP